MNTEKLFEICGGIDEWSRLYTICANSIDYFINTANIDTSEESFNKLKIIFNNVIDDIGEHWYRKNLGK